MAETTSIFTTIIQFVLSNLIYIIIGGGLLFFLYKYWTRNKTEPFKRVELDKEIKRDFDFLYDSFSTPIDKPINAGLISLGHAIGYVNIFYDKALSWPKNIKSNKQLLFLMKEQAKNKATKEEKNIKLKTPIRETEHLYCFKLCGSSPVKKTLARLFNFNTRYIMINKDLVKISNQINIDPNIQPIRYYDIIIYSKTARNYIENIAFKLTRKEELEEIANEIHKIKYLELKLARSVARLREKALIEKEKYRGQIESAEEG